MPVSAALLVANGPGGQDLSRGGQNFNRGEKGTSSVRLRKRRDDVNQPGRRKNRHSGDFSFFSPKYGKCSFYELLLTEVSRNLRNIF